MGFEFGIIVKIDDNLWSAFSLTKPKRKKQHVAKLSPHPTHSSCPHSQPLLPFTICLSQLVLYASGHSCRSQHVEVLTRGFSCPACSQEAEAMSDGYQAPCTSCILPAKQDFFFTAPSVGMGIDFGGMARIILPTYNPKFTSIWKVNLNIFTT